MRLAYEKLGMTIWADGAGRLGAGLPLQLGKFDSCHPLQNVLVIVTKNGSLYWHVADLVMRLTVNQDYGGSSPSLPAKLKGL